MHKRKRIRNDEMKTLVHRTVVVRKIIHIQHYFVVFFFRMTYVKVVLLQNSPQFNVDFWEFKNSQQLKIRTLFSWI